MMDDLPFVSFCIKCYNQEKLIGEALRGAFEQTYPNMEIVISDDCSTDGSVAVIRRMVEEYRKGGGRFPVTIIENEKNLGNGGNWQKICSVAKGEWFVKADGDDRSLPTRVEELMKCWIAGGRKAKALGSDAVLVDMSGRSLGPVRRAVLRTNRPAGCIAAYHRDTYDKFGTFEVSRAFDDCVYGPRAELLGTIEYVDSPLVLYRVGAGSCRSNSHFRATRVHMFDISKLWIRQCQIDLENYKDYLPVERYVQEKEKWAKWLCDVDYNIRYWGDDGAARRELIRLRPLRSLLSANGVFKIALLFPNRLCDCVIDAVSYWHTLFLRFRYGQKLGASVFSGFDIAKIIEKTC